MDFRPDESWERLHGGSQRWSLTNRATLPYNTCNLKWSKIMVQWCIQKLLCTTRLSGKKNKSPLKCIFFDCSHFGCIGWHFPTSKACHTVTCSYVRSSAIPLSIPDAASSRDLELVKPAAWGFCWKRSPAWQICSTRKFPSNARLFPSYTRFSRPIHIFPRPLAHSYKAYESVSESVVGHVAGYVREWNQDLQATEC